MGGGRRWGVVAVLLVLLSPFAPALAQSLWSPSQDPLTGSRVFGSKGCVKCHAVNGVGGKIGPDLGRIQRPRSFYDLAAAMWNHLPRMLERMRQLGIPRIRLEPQEAGDLIAFLFTLNYFDPPGDAKKGERLFVGKRCVVCHQVGGTGGVVGPNLDSLGQFGSPILVAAAMWNHGPAMAEAMRIRKIERPQFRGSELLDLIAYLKAAAPEFVEGPLYVLPGRPEEGRQLFAGKRCIECHSIRGQGGTMGPDLGERGLQLSLVQFAAAMWNKAPAMMTAMKARGISAPQLQALEMADIVAYLYAVRYIARRGSPQSGLRVAVAKGCLGCHALGGERGKIASDLAQVRGSDSPVAIISALWNHSVTPEDRTQPKRAWPRLAPEEMADLIAWLQLIGERR